MTAETASAIEIDPRSLTPEHIAAMAEMGITRASLGVQDFEERVQQAIRRPQSFEQTARAVDGLRAAGIANINLDLMYGLPHQTVRRSRRPRSARWRSIRIASRCSAMPMCRG